MSTNKPRWWGDDDPVGLPVAEAMRRCAIPSDAQQPVTINGLSVADNWKVEVVEIDGIAYNVYTPKAEDVSPTPPEA